MLQKDKELLLKDLCGRLPYGVIVQRKSREKKYNVVLSYGNISYVSQLGEGWWSECKPYLRQMSSMTEEEKNKLKEYLDASEVDCNGFGYSEGGTLEDYISSIPYSICVCVVDWLNKNMFDYRGLIPNNLAISTEVFNPYND